MTQQLAQAAPQGSTILLYSRLSDEECVLDARTVLVKDLHFDGWFLGNWLGRKNLLQNLLLSQQAQSLLATDLHSPIHKRFPLAAAQQGLETYLTQMSAGKVLLVADPAAVKLEVETKSACVPGRILSAAAGRPGCDIIRSGSNWQPGRCSLN